MSTRLIRLRRFIFNSSSRFFRHLPLIAISLIVIFFIFCGLKIKSFLRQAGLGKISFINVFRAPDKVLDSTVGRTNFLLLGIRGEGTDSPDLTDTLLVVSYSYATQTATLISVPRDLWVGSLKTKINSVYHYGQFRDPSGGGIKLTQSAILETLGLPIHYTAVINFRLFREAVDLVGGVDVNVLKAFTDNQFPIEGMETALPLTSRFETISFPAGWQHFDGITALKFVRSRHAEGDEGTDIARDHRQQQVLAALKQKILSPRFLANPANLTALYQLIKRHLDTNITEVVYPSLARLAIDTSRHPLRRVTLSYEPDENGVAILENPPVSSIYQNQWVLVARDNNWTALQQYLKNKLDSKQ